MKDPNLTELGNLFLALSDKTRLRLLALMADGEVSVGFLADSLGESQPKTSRHLAYLRNAGLVTTRRDGKRIHYDIQRPTDPAAERILSVTIDEISANGGARRSPWHSETNISAHDLFEETDDPYAETYESDYKPNELEIFLL